MDGQQDGVEGRKWENPGQGLHDVKKGEGAEPWRGCHASWIVIQIINSKAGHETNIPI